MPKSLVVLHYELLAIQANFRLDWSNFPEKYTQAFLVVPSVMNKEMMHAKKFINDQKKEIAGLQSKLEKLVASKKKSAAPKKAAKKVVKKAVKKASKKK